MKRWIHASEEVYSFPEKIWIELYPETHNGYEYVKDYEHEDGGCYYHSTENDDPITGSFVSLYPDGRLTYLWNGQEKPLNSEWHVVDDATGVHASAELIAPWNDPDLKFICNTDGYLVYRIVEDGKGKWYAHEQDAPIETMVPITYEQARGYEPMPNESSIRKLQRELGEMLLPPEGYVGAASKADATNELSADLLSVFEYIVGDIWTIQESSQGCPVVISEENFDKKEADRKVIKLNNELKRLGLSKHVVKVVSYWSGGEDDEESPMKVSMTLKRYIEI